MDPCQLASPIGSEPRLSTRAWSSASCGVRERGGPGVTAERGGRVIHEAVTDDTNRLRYPAGEDAKQYLANRSALDDATFIGGVKQQLGL
jgi:hypothetical protein